MRRLVLSILGGLLLVQCTSQSDVKVQLNRQDALILYYVQTEGDGRRFAAHRLFEELNRDPLKFYASMLKDSVAFNHFLFDLENVVFVTDTSKSDWTIENLEQWRFDTIKDLNALKAPDSLVVLHERLLQKLKEIKPKNIE